MRNFHPKYQQFLQMAMLMDSEVMPEHEAKALQKKINSQLKKLGAKFEVIEMEHPDGRKVITDDAEKYLKQGYTAHKGV